MATRNETSDREQFVEEMGITMEQSGIPRMAGKIFGCLLLSGVQEMSADELIAQLKTSRGSVSTMTRLLIQRGLIERAGRPGHRRDYFRIKTRTWSSILKAKMEELITFHDLIERGMEIVTQKDAVAYDRLRQMHEFYEFFENQFPALFERWEDYQKRSRKR
jgi:DNA-binding transcriptional regulator GbsR (MarR family)